MPLYLNGNAVCWLLLADSGAGAAVPAGGWQGDGRGPVLPGDLARGGGALGGGEERARSPERIANALQRWALVCERENRRLRVDIIGYSTQTKLLLQNYV